MNRIDVPRLADCPYCFTVGVVDHLDSFQRSSDLTMKIRSIACGDRHTIAISHLGEIYCWGRNAEGQLGLATDQPEAIWHPSLVEFYDATCHDDRKSGLYFYGISAGRDHTAAVAVSFPFGVSRQNSAIVSTPIGGSDTSAISGVMTPTFHSSLSRIGSKITLLCQRSKSRSRVDTIRNNSIYVEHPFMGKRGSTALFQLPSALSTCPNRPTLHAFQTLRSLASIDSFGSSETMQYAKKARHIPKVPISDMPRSNDFEAHLPGKTQQSGDLS